jgi:diguanylate cyclase (GGDEF)-like protein
MGRWASVGLGSLLLAVSIGGIVSSSQVSNGIERAEGAVATTDLYQQAGYFVAIEDAELNSYRITLLPADLTAHSTAEDSLDATLSALAAKADGAGALQVAGLVAAHRRYKDLSQQVVKRIDGGQIFQSSELETDAVEPVRDMLAVHLKKLETSQQSSSARALRVASLNGERLRWGTPIAFALTLVVIVGLSRVTRRHRRAVRYQALHDALTGLPNRMLFADRAAHVMAAARRTGAEPVVMMPDLARFQEVNDTFGQRQGDDLLVQVASRVSALVRAGDTVARLGGDKFALLLADGGSNAGSEAAGRILAALEEPFDLDGTAVGLEASIGIATAASEPSPENAPPDDAAQLMQHADAAMYRAKADRSGYAHYLAGADQRTHGHLALLAQLRQAFDHDELVLHFQPKVAADNGEVLGVEALVRWQHPVRGLLPPIAFIELAESTTPIHRLTTVVVDKALTFVRYRLDQGLPMPVAVNVSARGLLDQAFPAKIAAQLAHHGVPAELLWIEITEGTIMADPDKALAILTELRGMGIRLSVDDFGTGYSSMAYLKVLPVDELKVDRTFVKGMTTDEGDAVLVQSAIDLGHNLGLSVVAEGVEDDETLVALKNLGVDVVQGYFLGRPMAPELLDQWIVDRAIVALPR